jgi:hypothetical protein
MTDWFTVSLRDALTKSHNFNGGVTWRLAKDGVRIGDAAPENTGGRPATVARVLEDYGDSIVRWAAHYLTPVELIVATICTETRGRAEALRTEPGYISDNETPHRVSCGLTQTLISTARECLVEDGAIVDRDWLFEPDNAIRAGAAYINQQRRKRISIRQRSPALIMQAAFTPIMARKTAGKCASTRLGRAITQIASSPGSMIAFACSPPMAPRRRRHSIMRSMRFEPYSGGGVTPT